MDVSHSGSEAVAKGVQEYLNEVHRKQAGREAWKSSHVCYALAQSTLSTLETVESISVYNSQADVDRLLRENRNRMPWQISVEEAINQ